MQEASLKTTLQTRWDNAGVRRDPFVKLLPFVALFMSHEL